jgi:hypothetical protein
LLFWKKDRNAGKIRAIALWEKEQLRYTQGMIRLL